MNDYNDDVLNAEWVLIKKRTIKRHLFSEVLAWAVVGILLLTICIF